DDAFRQTTPAYHGAPCGETEWFGIDRLNPGGGARHAGRSLFAEAAFGGEELAEHAGAAFGQHASHDLRPVVQAAVGGDVVQRVTGAGLGVGAAVHHHRQPGLHDGPGAHRTRLQCDVEHAAVEAPGP